MSLGRVQEVGWRTFEKYSIEGMKPALVGYFVGETSEAVRGLSECR